MEQFPFGLMVEVSLSSALNARLQLDVDLSGAIASDDQVRVTPSIRSQKGWIWSKNTMTADHWLLEVKIRVNGRGRVGADGMVSRFQSSDRSSHSLLTDSRCR